MESSEPRDHAVSDSRSKMESGCSGRFFIRALQSYTFCAVVLALAVPIPLAALHLEDPASLAEASRSFCEQKFRKVLAEASQQDIMVALTLFAWLSGATFVMWHDYTAFCKENERRDKTSPRCDNASEIRVEDVRRRESFFWRHTKSITIPILLCIIWGSLVANGHSLEICIPPILLEPYRDIENASDTALVILVATWMLVGMAVSRLDMQNFSTARWKPETRPQAH